MNQLFIIENFLYKAPDSTHPWSPNARRLWRHDSPYQELRQEGVGAHNVERGDTEQLLWIVRPDALHDLGGDGHS